MGSVNPQQFEKMKNDKGFIAALDQSGGSTPKLLEQYGIAKSQYKNEVEMFDLVHQMRTRLITSLSFTSEHILGTILFEITLTSTIEGLSTGKYLWQKKQIVPFLKVDNGLADESDGVQMMKPIDDLDAKLQKAQQNDVFGTKMRSVINLANPVGIKSVVKQQFEYAQKILAADLMPIVEPEVSIKSDQKAQAEELLKNEILRSLDNLKPDQQVMLKLTLPETADFYQELVEHPKVLRFVALSGGYSRDEANAKLRANHGVIASFNRALAEGLAADQSDSEFNSTLSDSIESIYEASVNKL